MIIKGSSFFILLLLFFSVHTFGQDVQYEILKNIPYYPNNKNQQDSYIKERCVLDLYFPKHLDHYPTIIWFHGGGLTSGNKFIPKALKKKGVAVVAVNYRLYPKVKSPAYIQDAAASVSWVFKNIENYGGDPSLIFISGHSAGGYLTSMVGMDKRWLAAHDIEADNIAGLIPLSGHTITHVTVRKERGFEGTQPIVDDLAPLYHVRSDAPPLLLITGDREKELLGRYEENALMMRMMKVAGHKDTKLYELDGYGHGMTGPAYPLLLKEDQRITNVKRRPNILFIIADDASWKHFGAYGSKVARTPNIDKLAKEGVLFENAFVSTSSCTPSRASILTGRNGFELEEGATILAKVAQMLLNKGKYGNLQFFSEQTYEKLIPLELNQFYPKLDNKWGIGITNMDWKYKDPETGEERYLVSKGIIGHGSATASVFWVIPKHNMIITQSRRRGGRKYAPNMINRMKVVEKHLIE